MEEAAKKLLNQKKQVEQVRMRAEASLEVFTEKLKEALTNLESLGYSAKQAAERIAELEVYIQDKEKEIEGNL